MDQVSSLDYGVTAQRTSRNQPTTHLLLTLRMSRQLYTALACFCADFPKLAYELENALDAPLHSRSRRDDVRLVMEPETARQFSETLSFQPIADRFFTTVSGAQLRTQWAATLTSAT